MFFFVQVLFLDNRSFGRREEKFARLVILKMDKVIGKKGITYPFNFVPFLIHFYYHRSTI